MNYFIKVSVFFTVCERAITRVGKGKNNSKEYNRKNYINTSLILIVKGHIKRSFVLARIIYIVVGGSIIYLNLIYKL